MFKIESYITPILLNYVDKYVKDFKPANAQVSLWAGGVALHNLVLKPDVLLQDVSLPFSLVSGRIHELLIQVPWTKIMSEPIVISIDTIECILGLPPPDDSEGSQNDQEPKTPETPEAPPGYMQALVRRIVSNISLRIQHLIVKYVEDDIVLSLNVKRITIDSADAQWNPAFADIDPVFPLLRRLVKLDDLTLCLDRADSDGKIRFFQEPLLYRCQINFRILSKLISANTRRATNLHVQIHASQLAWGLTTDQISLLIRLFKNHYQENLVIAQKVTVLKPPSSETSAQSLALLPKADTSPSWSGWAWSWLPSWSEHQEDIEELPHQAMSFPIHFTAYLDHMTFIFKVMESEGTSRKKTRGILELVVKHTALRGLYIMPTTLEATLGILSIELKAHGRCMCNLNNEQINEQPKLYLSRFSQSEEASFRNWPEDLFEGPNMTPEQKQSSPTHTSPSMPQTSKTASIGVSMEAGRSSELIITEGREKESSRVWKYDDPLWQAMQPLLFAVFKHDRMPPDPDINPYENPPKRFLYSDWVENCQITVQVQPVELRICTCLIHRLGPLVTSLQELTSIKEQTKKLLTVEECASLSENLPQRRIEIELYDARILLIPWEQTIREKHIPPQLMLQLHIPKALLQINMPLYPKRVCAAASQIPLKMQTTSNIMWHGARLHVTLNVDSLYAHLMAITGKGEQPSSLPVASTHFRLVVHRLMHPSLFLSNETVLVSYTLSIKELTLCGSRARIQAAWAIIESLYLQKVSTLLRFTTIATDAVADEEFGAIDLTMEGFVLKGFITRNINTHVLRLQSFRIMVLKKYACESPLLNIGLPQGPPMWSIVCGLHPVAFRDFLEAKFFTVIYCMHLKSSCLQLLNNKSEEALRYLEGNIMKIAWLFSGSDSSSKAAFFRTAVQWCKEPMENSLDFLGIWMESMAFSADPLFVAWLAYEPQLKPSTGQSTGSLRSIRSTMMSSSAYLKRRAAHSSSGRGASRSGQELVHSARARSQESVSSDQPKERQPSVSKPAPAWWQGDGLISLYKRLKHLLISMEIGLVTVYVPLETASAIDSETVKEALDMHVVAGNTVMGINLGQISVDCSETMSVLWHYITNDGPTIIERNDSEEKSFPWRMNFSDVSCYLLETAVPHGKKSQLRHSAAFAIPCQILELVTTTITLSVITKTVPQSAPQSTKESKVEEAETVTKHKSSLEGDKSKAGPANETIDEDTEVKKNVLVGLGINVHADTPPLMIKLDQDQVHSVAACFHGLGHIFELLTRESVVTKKRLLACSRLLTRSVSEAEETAPPVDDASDSDSELLTIFENHHHTLGELLKQKSSFWFQWVINRATLAIASGPLKLVLNVDDIISTLDIQSHYNQLKIKINSAFIRNYERASNDEWTSAAYGGHILEAREPINAVEDNHFLAVTVTNAQISNLPSTWKMEMDPKILQASAVQDTMWEVYATMAPLDITLKPEVVSDIIKLLREMTIRSQCPFKVEKSLSLSTLQWPYFYLACGGVNILFHSDLPNLSAEDAFLITIRKTTVNPHPENPISRRPPSGSQEGAIWMPSNGALEGRQYEFHIKSIEISHAQASQILQNEKTKDEQQAGGTASENPAVKWTEPTSAPMLTSILNPMEVSCILAPPLYMSNMVVCGPALEINLVTDCFIEISLVQLQLINEFMLQFDYSLDVNPVTLREHNTCPYADLITPRKTQDDQNPSRGTKESKISRSEDSGVNSLSNAGMSSGKKVSYGFLGCTDPEQAGYSELFVTTGLIKLTLYTQDDNSSELWLLRPKPTYKYVEPESTPQPPVAHVAPATHALHTLHNIHAAHELHSQSDKQHRDARSQPHSAASITETVRQADVGQLELKAGGLATRKPNTIKLIQVTLKQPNIYFWRRKSQKSLQVSLFNLLVNMGFDESKVGALFYTAPGQADPLTDIPPALAILKVYVNTNGGYASRGSLTLDIERPVMMSITEEKLKRLQKIKKLIRNCFTFSTQPKKKTEPSKDPPLYQLAQLLSLNNVDTVTITTTQLGLSCALGVIGWASGSLQVAVTPRLDRMVIRTYVNALMVTLGPEEERRLVINPLVCGAYLQAAWEKWQQSEITLDSKEPLVKLTLDLDNLIIDLRPDDAVILKTIVRIFKKYLGIKSEEEHGPVKRRSSLKRQVRDDLSDDDPDEQNQYYKDDLRTGAFKILTGGQFPLAYQITLNNGCVSWKYPHPRAIAKILAYPLPSQTTEVCCVLEHYNTLLDQWEPHIYFTIPVLEAQEMSLLSTPPSAIAALMWRCRPIAMRGDEYPPFEFRSQRYTPKKEPFAPEDPPQNTFPSLAKDVSAEELLGALRVDSIFAPKQLPTKIATCRLAELRAYLHNSLPRLSSDATTLEGYYVSKPYRKSHRVLGLLVLNSVFNGQLNNQQGSLLLMDTRLGVQTIDCMTGAMDHTIENTRFQAAFAYPLPDGTHPKLRYVSSPLVVSLTMVKVKTLMSLIDDWRFHLKGKRHIEIPTLKSELEPGQHTSKPKRDIAQHTGSILEGRIAMWLHNSCSSALRVGQEGTDEVVPLGPGGRLAYRWRSPTAKKMLRFTITTPSSDWHWSPSVPFTPGNYRVRLTDGGESKEGAIGKFLFVQVSETATRRLMHIHGRVALVNMLRFPLLYEVRSRVPQTKKWYTIGSGELGTETVGRTVITTMESELVFKIKFAQHKTGWSGDVPLKECPKENVPWLVKVPSDGDLPFISVWCRVIRGRNDARILATIWPLYILQSHLPLDTDVLVTTETEKRRPHVEEESQSQYPPLIQSVPGRGTTSHIYVPGTTSVRHSLTFQYRNIECPVTKETVPLHYGVTEGSVFDKKVAVNNIEDVLNDLLAWLKESGSNAHSGWPYSVVSDHWPEPWKPALLQPRCDISIRYHPIYAGGGCCLGMQVSPVLLLCNATTLTLTLRAHNAAPLCKIEPGTAISPSSNLLEHPFFMSMEMGRETFVSGSLQVSNAAPARYAAPPPGTVAIDHPAPFAIQCNNKVALLTLYYEVKNNMNVLGVSCTYVLINKLDYEVLVSATAVPKTFDYQEPMKPTTFTTVHPALNDSNHGSFLCRFTIFGRWIGNDVDELNLYLNLVLADEGNLTSEPVPVRLGAPPARRALALVNDEKESVPIVVSQVKMGGRWLVMLSEDPCPQFLVRNRTTQPILLAQPNLTHDPFNSNPSMVNDCEGVQWHCKVMPGAILHYSTPSYCQRHPPASSPKRHSSSGEPPWNYLTFGKIDPTEGKLLWSCPVPVVAGEQLVQLPGNHIVKLKVRPHPHSTLIELQNIDHLDISASDIRKRLDSTSLTTSIFVSERVTSNKSLLISSATACDKESAQDESTKSVQVAECDLSKRSSCDNSEDDATAPLSVRPMLSLEDGDEFFNKGTGYGLSKWDFLRGTLAGLVVKVASAPEVEPLMALHADRVSLRILQDRQGLTFFIAARELQVDNLQYPSGQYDFAVVAATSGAPVQPVPWPPLFTMMSEVELFEIRDEDSRLFVRIVQDKWRVCRRPYKEITELEIKLGPLGLYIEDAYVQALEHLIRMALPAKSENDHISAAVAEMQAIARPLRLRVLHIRPLDLTLTLHTAVRIYIALDQSPLCLSAFKLRDMMTSAERLTHALTVHYLSATLLGAGWVVGGLELLGAPGAVAARVGGARGGVRGVASAAAAALLRSLAACAGSLARNLDLLAGDEEHSRRAAAARRAPPHSLLAGLYAGVTNFAVNILGAVGGLAHHPLVAVGAGESVGGALALRRGLLGALAKPLSATADLVAFAGHGLLAQTGWDPLPQPRALIPPLEGPMTIWQCNCVRWAFRLHEMSALIAYQVLLDRASTLLVITEKLLVIIDPESERVLEMLDMKCCSIAPYQGHVIELFVQQTKKPVKETRGEEEEEYQVSEAAMARVARYTGASSGGAGSGSRRAVTLLPAPALSHALHATLTALLHHNADTHFSFL